MISINDLPFFKVVTNIEEGDIFSSDFIRILNERSKGNFYGTQGRYSAFITDGAYSFYRKAIPSIEDENSYYIEYCESEPTDWEGKYLSVDIDSNTISETIILNNSFQIDYSILLSRLKNLFVDDDNYFYSMKHHHWDQFLGLDLQYPLDAVDLFCNGNLITLTFRPSQGEFHLESSKWIDESFQWGGDTDLSVSQILEVVLSLI